MTIRIYEIKLTRADFLGDVNRGKYRRYMESSHQLYFAVKSGLIKKEEVPEGCGLITRSDITWRVSKSAPRREYTPDINFLQSLLLKGYENHWQEYRKLEKDRFQEYSGLRPFVSYYGVKVAEDIARGQEFIQEAQRLEKEINEVLGIKSRGYFGSFYDLRAEVDKLLGQYKYAEEAIMVAHTAMDLFNHGSMARTRRNAINVLRRLADKLDDEKEGGTTDG